MVGELTGREQDSLESWVEAAPFRAHLSHLAATSGLSPTGVALLAGVSPRFAHHLLNGRGGRLLRRISPDSARKLLRVTPADARAARGRVVPAEATLRHLQRLRLAGWTDPQLAQALGLSADEAAGLRTGALDSCTQLVALLAAAEVSLLLTPLPGQPGPARAAA